MKHSDRINKDELSTIIKLSAKNAKLVFDLLEEPGKPNAKMLEAIELYKKSGLWNG